MKVVRHPRPGAADCVLAIGSFDGFHLGHQAIVAQVAAKARARRLDAAVLTFDPLPREFFAPAEAPARLTTLAERIELLSHTPLATLYAERFHAGFARLSAGEFERRLRSHYGARWVYVGRDFRYGAQRAGDVASLAAAGERLGFQVVVVEEVMRAGERISSTRVRAALAAGELGEATRLLGRPYAICGRVAHGAKRGRTLGFPTANVRLGRARPALWGVFAVKCFGAATRGLEGVASLGTNPAVNRGGPATLEAFLFDFSGDLYGRRLTIEFRKKLRDEAHFASMEALAAQIGDDCEAARRYFRSL